MQPQIVPQTYFPKPDWRGDPFLLPERGAECKKDRIGRPEVAIIKLTEPCFPNQHKQI